MTRDPIERIEEGLTKLGAEHEPPAGWERRVVVEADRRLARRGRKKLAAVVAIAVVIALIAIYAR